MGFPQLTKAIIWKSEIESIEGIYRISMPCLQSVAKQEGDNKIGKVRSLTKARLSVTDLWIRQVGLMIDGNQLRKAGCDVDNQVEEEAFTENNRKGGNPRTWQHTDGKTVSDLDEHHMSANHHVDALSKPRIIQKRFEAAPKRTSRTARFADL